MDATKALLVVGAIILASYMCVDGYTRARRDRNHVFAVIYAIGALAILHATVRLVLLLMGV